MTPSSRFATPRISRWQGPVYNEGERVEGYTAFPWVTLLRAGYRLDPVVGAVCALAAMTRPGCGLLFATLVTGRFVAWRRQVPRGWLRLTAGFASLYLPYYLWRNQYYGWLLPNTFQAKVGSNAAQVKRGFEYFLGWASAPLLLLVPLLLAPVLWRSLAGRSRLPVELWIFVAVHAVYVIAVGGDVMPACRFFAPILPVVSLCSASTVAYVTRWRGAVWLPAALVTGFNLWQFTHNANHPTWIREVRVAAMGRVTGLFLRQSVPRIGCWPPQTPVSERSRALRTARVSRTLPIRESTFAERQDLAALRTQGP